MAAFLIDVAPPTNDRELLVMIAVVVIVIAVVSVVALATGIFIFIRLRKSRAADAGRVSWAGLKGEPAQQTPRFPLT
ncbi:MAG TPA: hypothetical protein VJS64_04755 [Pyrinomonadaceae bacterium]|nr:hypothetical protein [Pyrinomonadaceae bacterium]